MKLPNEALLDALNYLDRSDLDAAQMCTRRFRNLVGSLNTVCLRNLHFACITQSYAHYTSLWYKVCAGWTIGGLTPYEKYREYAVPEDEAGQRFGEMVASSYINLLKIVAVPLTDALFMPMQSFLGAVNPDEVWMYCGDFDRLEPKVLAEWIRSFGSISGDADGNLNVWITLSKNIRQEHIDVLRRFNKRRELVAKSGIYRNNSRPITSKEGSKDGS